MQDHISTTELKPYPRRINVAVSPSEIDALALLVKREGVSLTEATRRLLGYGLVLYQAAVVDGGTVTVTTEQETRQIVVL